MKKAVLFSAMGAIAAWGTVAHAEEFGRVISATPVVQQVAVPRQTCSVQPVAAQPGGGGAVLGAIVGGLLGNTIGHGTGRAVATGVGVVAGAGVGNTIEANGARAQGMQQCSTQTSYENRTVAYNVTYEYAGKQYSVQMPNDPGPTIRLQLTPVGATSDAPQGVMQSQDGNTYVPQQVYVSPVAVPSATVGYPVYYTRPYYPAYYPYYAPIGVSIGLGYYGGGGHRHWR